MVMKQKDDKSIEKVGSRKFVLSPPSLRAQSSRTILLMMACNFTNLLTALHAYGGDLRAFSGDYAHGTCVE